MRVFFKFMICLTIAFLAFAGYVHFHFRYGAADTIVRTLLFPFFATNYAAGFSEAKFALVKAGMSREQVTSIVGEPLRETCMTNCEWVYSWQLDPTASFDRRSIYFSREGFVLRTVKDVFLD